MITTKIVLLGEFHPARSKGYSYNVQILIDGIYAGVGKFCKTLADAEEYAAEL